MPYSLAEVPCLLGSSSSMCRVRHEISRAAKSDAKVLITGGSGSGKEVAARCIHSQGWRRAAKLMAINCAGIPDTLLEAELFGHVRGSFTGADRDRPGVLSLCNHGTLFMDEVGDMSPRMQALLLRFLDTGEVNPVGGNGVSTRVDVRIISATNRNLPERIGAGLFRSDLYYRLNVICLRMPSLRERPEDIPVLLESLLRAAAGRQRVPAPNCRPGLLRQLLDYHWPGNVRELRNVAERMVLLADQDVQDLQDLLPSVTASADTREPESREHDQSEPAGLFSRMVRDGEGFWNVIHAPFLSHDLTRDQVRNVIRQGLEKTHGSYKQLLGLFNMQTEDYKRFLSFLRKYDCQLPFQDFRPRASEHPTRLGHGLSPR